MKARVEKYFGDIPAGPPTARQEAWVAKRTGSQRGVMYDRVPQARVYKVWNVPGWGTADGDDLNLLGNLLSSGKSSRLYKRLVYDEQIATGVSASPDLREIGGLFVIQATAKPGGDLAQVERAVDEELARFLRRGSHGGRAAAGEDRLSGGLHPRRRAHRWLRRQVRRAGAG